MNKAIVTIADNPFWPKGDIIHISDDRCAVIYRVSVWTALAEEEHLIIHTLPHSIGQAERQAINRNLRETTASATISFHVDDREGWAQVITGPDEKFDPFNLAAAIAVIKASWGWDESRPMVVMINGAEVCVWPRVDGQYWIAADVADEIV